MRPGVLTREEARIAMTRFLSRKTTFVLHGPRGRKPLRCVQMYFACRSRRKLDPKKQGKKREGGLKKARWWLYRLSP